MKKILLLVLVVLAGCSNPPAPVEKSVAPDSGVKKKVPAAKPVANPWSVKSFAAKEGETNGRKYVKISAEGKYSDSTHTDAWLYAEVYVDKLNAGFFLHELKKTGPSEKFNVPVQIKMTNANGQELLLTSTKSWNSSGGILIERNNNDYSQFRIFMLQSTGTVSVVISDQLSKEYRFNISADGFSTAFSNI